MLSLESHAKQREEQRDLAGRCVVKRCQESEPALISVMFSFLLCPSKVKYHWLKSGKGVDCQSVMFDEEPLDHHGVGNLPHILTRTDKSSTSGVRESAYY